MSDLDAACRRLQRSAIDAVSAAEQQNVELAQEIVALRSTIDASGLYDMHVLLSESNAKHEKEKGASVPLQYLRSFIYSRTQTNEIPSYFD